MARNLRDVIASHLQSQRYDRSSIAAMSLHRMFHGLRVTRGEASSDVPSLKHSDLDGERPMKHVETRLKQEQER